MRQTDDGYIKMLLDTAKERQRENDIRYDEMYLEGVIETLSWLLGEHRDLPVIICFAVITRTTG
ncbi:MAG: hypothetical protein HQK98_06990 [Nitrospirae bacterium]|nr:hypothetical protein [Nitrospirota bacterium]